MVSLGLVTHDHLEGECLNNWSLVQVPWRFLQQNCGCLHCRNSEQTAGEEEENDGQPGVQWRCVWTWGINSLLKVCFPIQILFDRWTRYLNKAGILLLMLFSRLFTCLHILHLPSYSPTILKSYVNHPLGCSLFFFLPSLGTRNQQRLNFS